MFQPSRESVNAKMQSCCLVYLNCRKLDHVEVMSTRFFYSNKLLLSIKHATVTIKNETRTLKLKPKTSV